MVGDIKVIGGVAHPELRGSSARTSGSRSRAPRRALREREPDGADRRERPRGGRLRDPDLVPAGVGRNPRAAHHDRRPAARFGRAHDRGDPVLPVRAVGQEGPAAHLDHGAADGGPARDGGRQARAHDGPARAAGAGLLPHADRPHEGGADALRPPRADARPRETVLVAGDVGETKDVGRYAKRLGLPIAIVDKRRTATTTARSP